MVRLPKGGGMVIRRGSEGAWPALDPHRRVDQCSDALC